MFFNDNNNNKKNSGEEKEGISLLIKATQSDPTLYPAWSNLANGYFRLEKGKLVNSNMSS